MLGNCLHFNYKEEKKRKKENVSYFLKDYKYTHIYTYIYINNNAGLRNNILSYINYMFVLVYTYYGII